MSERPQHTAAAYKKASKNLPETQKSSETVTVEFYGVPRARAGRASLEVDGSTVAEILAAVARVCPGLRDLLGPDGRLAGHYMVSVNGRRFASQLDQPVSSRDRVIVLSADAGG